jgi:hypothetical protein
LYAFHDVIEIFGEVERVVVERGDADFDVKLG